MCENEVILLSTLQHLEPRFQAFLFSEWLNHYRPSQKYTDHE